MHKTIAIVFDFDDTLAPDSRVLERIMGHLFTGNVPDDGFRPDRQSQWEVVMRYAALRIVILGLLGVSVARGDDLSSGQKQVLANYASACTRYFTSTQSNNKAVGFTHSWCGIEPQGQWRTFESDVATNPPWTQNRGYGSDVNMNEVTLSFVVLACAYKMNWLGYLPDAQRYQASWGQIKTGLNTLRNLQTSGDPNQYTAGTFHRFYRTTTSDSTCRDYTNGEIVRTAENTQSSDDNGLPFMNLLVLEGLAQDALPSVSIADLQTVTNLCREIRSKINLSRFVTNNCIAMAITNGVSSWPAGKWDRLGAEGAPILAALLLSGKIPVSQFYQMASNLEAKTVDWPSTNQPAATNTIRQATYHSAMFMHGLRAIHGMPVTTQEVANAAYFKDSTYPVFVAHREFAVSNSLRALGSQVMSQRLDNYPLLEHVDPAAQCVFPGNEATNMPVYRQNAGDHALARNTGPHALFIPLMRSSLLTTTEVAWTFASLAAYTNGFFRSGSDTALGWEAVIPWKPWDDTNCWVDVMGRTNYADAGHPFEALNAAYISVSCFDALNTNPLASYSVDHERLGHIAAYYDRGIPLPTRPPTATITLFAPANQVSISATGTAYFGIITQVVIRADGTTLATAASNSCFGVWTNPSVSTHEIAVQVWDDRGGTSVTTNRFIPGLWGEAVDGGGGWRYLAWFGYFKDVGAGWIYHAEHGWLYCVGIYPSSIWFWSSRLGWLWSSSSAYPFLWHNAAGAWLYYYRGTGHGSGGWFYNYGTGKTEWR